MGEKSKRVFRTLNLSVIQAAGIRGGERSEKVDMGEFIKQAELTGYDLDDEEE